MWDVCELDCKRGMVSDAMSIREIKRYAAAHDTGTYWKGKGKQLPDTGKKVCVVGGGPAGMTSAYYLRKQGHDVTLKEALPTVGGMMAYGIPAYRLPREIVAKEYSYIEETGIHTEVNTRVEKPVELLKGGNTGEKEPRTKGVMAILGCISMGVGYWIAITTKNPLGAVNLFFVAVLLVIVGTYLLFAAGSIAVLKLLRSRKEFYYYHERNVWRRFLS